MFLDQDQMYLRMCNVNKEKISLENTWRPSFIMALMCFHLFIYLSISYLKQLCAHNFLIIYIQKL